VFFIWPSRSAPVPRSTPASYRRDSTRLPDSRPTPFESVAHPVRASYATFSTLACFSLHEIWFSKGDSVRSFSSRRLFFGRGVLRPFRHRLRMSCPSGSPVQKMIDHYVRWRNSHRYLLDTISRRQKQNTQKNKNPPSTLKRARQSTQIDSPPDGLRRCHLTYTERRCTTRYWIQVS